MELQYKNCKFTTKVIKGIVYAPQCINPKISIHFDKWGKDINHCHCQQSHILSSSSTRAAPTSGNWGCTEYLAAIWQKIHKIYTDFTVGSLGIIMLILGNGWSNLVCVSRGSHLNCISCPLKSLSSSHLLVHNWGVLIIFYGGRDICPNGIK